MSRFHHAVVTKKVVSETDARKEDSFVKQIVADKTMRRNQRLSSSTELAVHSFALIVGLEVVLEGCTFIVLIVAEGVRKESNRPTRRCKGSGVRDKVDPFTVEINSERLWSVGSGHFENCFRLVDFEMKKK
jgi:hypothetical protein